MGRGHRRGPARPGGSGSLPPGVPIRVPRSSSPWVLLCPGVLPGLSPCDLCPHVSVPPLPPGNLLPPCSPRPPCARVPSVCPVPPACRCSPPRPCACDPRVSLSLPRLSVSPVPLGSHGAGSVPRPAGCFGVSPLSGRDCRGFPLPSRARVSGPAPRVPRGWAVSEGGTCPRWVKIAAGGGGRGAAGAAERQQPEGTGPGGNGGTGRGVTGSGREGAGRGAPGRRTGGQRGRPGRA